MLMSGLWRTKKIAFLHNIFLLFWKRHQGGNGESISVMLLETVFSSHHILTNVNESDLNYGSLFLTVPSLPYFQCSGYGFGWPVINWPPGSGPDPCYIIKNSNKFQKKFQYFITYRDLRPIDDIFFQWSIKDQVRFRSGSGRIRKQLDSQIRKKYLRIRNLPNSVFRLILRLICSAPVLFSPF